MDYNSICLVFVLLILTTVQGRVKHRNAPRRVEHRNIQGRVIQRNEDEMNPKFTLYAKLYLAKYGYLRDSDDLASLSGGSSTLDRSLSTALLRFQSMAKIPLTGVADALTMQMMRAQRCGVPDHMTDAEVQRTNGYALRGSSHLEENTYKTLTYKINKYSGRLSRDAQRDIFANAFMMWSNVTRLNFRSLNYGLLRFLIGKINITFAKGNHGDGEMNSFDGPYGTLAHVYFPDTTRRGEIHFDDDEQWATNNRQGTDLLQTAVHEIGHILGLLHSEVKGSIMYPIYDPTLTNVRLHSDDIARIQAIYGQRLRRGK